MSVRSGIPATTAPARAPASHERGEKADKASSTARTSSGSKGVEHRQRLEQLGLAPRVWPTRARWTRVQRLADDYTVLNVLGSGATGHALLVRDKRVVGEVPVVLKIYVPPGHSHESAAEIETSMAAEFDTLVSIYRASGTRGHRNVVSYLDRFVWAPQEQEDVPDPLRKLGYEPGNEYTVLGLEYVGGADLSQFSEEWWARHKRTNTPPPPSLMRRLLRGALSGLSFLHALGIAHRDIKPGNMRVRETTEDLVLIDLGFACNIMYDHEEEEPLACQRRPYVGSPVFISPEFAASVASRRPLSTVQAMASDVWSLALAMLFFATGTYPHPRALTLPHVLRALSEYASPPRVVYDQDDELNTLFRSMLDRDWRRRVTATAALAILDTMHDPAHPVSAQETTRAAKDTVIPRLRNVFFAPAKRTVKRTHSMT